MSEPQQPGDPTQPGPPNPYPYQPPQYGAPPPQYGAPPPQYGAPPPQYGGPQYGPPPQQPDTIQFGPAPTTPDPYGYSYPPFAEAAQPPKRSRTPIFIAIAVAVALVLSGAGVAGAWVWYGWGETQAEEVLPGTASVFARVDLSPGLGQKLKIDKLAKKFPKDERTTQDFVEKLERDLLKTLDLGMLNYDTDIKPWFGERVGVAAWSPRDKQMCGLIALASKDDGKAAAALDKARKSRSDSFGYAFNNGYAVVAQCSENAQAGAEAAVAEAKRANLSQRSTFKSEVSQLPGGQTVLAWVDIDQLVDQSGGLSEMFGGQVGGELSGLEDQIKGRVVIGAQATSSGLDVRFRFANGVKAPSGLKDVTNDLDALPGNSAIAAAIRPNATDDMLDQVEKALKLDESELGPDAARVTEGMRALLRSVVTVSVTDVSGDDPAARLVATAANGADAAKLADLVDLIEEESGSDLPDSFKVSKNGNAVTVTVGPFDGSGRLGGNDLYKEAMAGADGTSTAAIYVNVQKIVDSTKSSEEDAKYLRPIKAVGFTSGYDGDTAVGLLRVVIK